MTPLDALRRTRRPAAGGRGAPLWVGDPAACDPGRVGGKAANLSRLADRWAVPAGFCLPAELHHDLGDAGPREAARVVRGVVAPAYRELAARVGRRRPGVAVRSSAVDEDSAEASFAGQHETVLNAVGAGQVAAAVARCWRSAHSEHARAYRASRGLAGAGAVAVVVQELVPAEVSVVGFSVNPVTGDEGQLLLNASWGLGEAVVAGGVTPDTYVVSRAPLAVVDREVATKDVMVVPRRRGTREVAVPPARRTEPALSREQCLEVARLLLDLEATMGWHVDVECAYRGERLVLLQCRPVTSLPG